jgi:hypothetical protein
MNNKRKYRHMSIPKILISEFFDIRIKAGIGNVDEMINKMIDNYHIKHLKGFRPKKVYPSKAKTTIRMLRETYLRLKELSIKEEIPIYELLRGLMFSYRVILRENLREFREKELDAYIKQQLD